MTQSHHISYLSRVELFSWRWLHSPCNIGGNNVLIFRYFNVATGNDISFNYLFITFIWIPSTTLVSTMEIFAVCTVSRYCFLLPKWVQAFRSFQAFKLWDSVNYFVCSIQSFPLLYLALQLYLQYFEMERIDVLISMTCFTETRPFACKVLCLLYFFSSCFI